MLLHGTTKAILRCFPVANIAAHVSSQRSSDNSIPTSYRTRFHTPLSYRSTDDRPAHGMGIKLYTGFTERSILITCSFSNAGVPSPSPYIRRIETTKGLDEAWRLHQSNVLDVESYGKVVVPQVSFNTYVDMSRREEETFK